MSEPSASPQKRTEFESSSPPIQQNQEPSAYDVVWEPSSKNTKLRNAFYDHPDRDKETQTEALTSASEDVSEDVSASEDGKTQRTSFVEYPTTLELHLDDSGLPRSASPPVPKFPVPNPDKWVPTRRCQVGGSGKMRRQQEQRKLKYEEYQAEQAQNKDKAILSKALKGTGADADGTYSNKDMGLEFRRRSLDGVLCAAKVKDFFLNSKTISRVDFIPSAPSDTVDDCLMRMNHWLAGFHRGANSVFKVETVYIPWPEKTVTTSCRGGIFAQPEFRVKSIRLHYFTEGEPTHQQIFLHGHGTEPADFPYPDPQTNNAGSGVRAFMDQLVVAMLLSLLASSLLLLVRELVL